MGRMRLAPAVALTCLVLTLAACSGPSPTTPTAGPSAGTASTGSPAVGDPSASSTTAAPLDAAAVVRRLAMADPEVSGVLVQNAQTDPNHQIGRPGGYSGRASFDLPGGDPGAAKGDTVRGGCLEVFPDAAGARRRAGYLEGLASTSPELAGQY